MFNVCAKRAKCERLIEQSLSGKLFGMHRNMRKSWSVSRNVMKLRKQHEYPLGRGPNPVISDMPESTTATSAGERTVHIRTTRAKKQRCTVILAVTADGQKLPL
jgi:hypothetical protein